MDRKELIKRYLLFITGLFFSAMGVACAKHAGLGVSPISSVANVMSIRFPVLSLGTWLTLWNCVLILGQILILRKDFKLYQLLQVPLSFVFGWFTDLGMFFVSPMTLSTYPAKLAMVLLGIVLLAFGIALAVVANVILNSGEAFVKAVSDVSGWEFGNVKTVFDISCVALAAALSLLFCGFRIVGIREGTVLTALLTGRITRFFSSRIAAPLNKILTR